MALIKTKNAYTTYARVDRIIIGKHDEPVQLTIGFYEQKLDEQKNSVLIYKSSMQFVFFNNEMNSREEHKLFSPDALTNESVNPWIVAYNYLKTLPLFSDFINA